MRRIIVQGPRLKGWEPYSDPKGSAKGLLSLAKAYGGLTQALWSLIENSFELTETLNACARSSEALPSSKYTKISI